MPNQLLPLPPFENGFRCGNQLNMNFIVLNFHLPNQENEMLDIIFFFFFDGASIHKHPQTEWLGYRPFPFFSRISCGEKGGTRTGKKGNSARRERKFHQKICPTCPQLLQVACSFRVLSIKHVSLVSEDLVEKYFFFGYFFYLLRIFVSKYSREKKQAFSTVRGKREKAAIASHRERSFEGEWRHETEVFEARDAAGGSWRKCWRAGWDTSAPWRSNAMQTEEE